MSSFYGNGGYSSGGGGGSGEVISVNGKKGQVTLNAADVHALPDTTQIPSLEGFATEAWVNNQDFLISEDINGKADKTEIISKPATAGTEGQVLTIDANGNPIWDNTSSDMSNYYTKSEIDEMIPENNLTNIVDGSASGSVRGINTKSEDSSYKMGNNAWAEGLNTMASGKSSHAEGVGAIASGDFSHVEGREDTIRLTLSGDANSLTYTFDYVDEGGANYIASFIFSGVVKLISNNSSDSTTVTNVDIENKTLTVDTTLSTEAINNVGYTLVIYPTASGEASHVEGTSVASGLYAHAEGRYTEASNQVTHAEGYHTIASNQIAHAEGYWTTASGAFSHAENGWTTSSGDFSHAEGETTTASADGSHAEGCSTTASGQYAHAEGNETTASKAMAHAEGYQTTASGDCSHAEGQGTTASGELAHAEGYWATASGNTSHAEGYHSTASGKYSHAEGFYTIAQRESQHVFGEYNTADTNGTQTTRGNYVEVVGNGASNSARSNARTLDWSGNEVLAGKLTVGTNPTASMDVATKQYVDSTMSNYALKSEIPTVTNDFTDAYKNKVDSLWEDYQDAITALG